MSQVDLTRIKHKQSHDMTSLYTLLDSEIMVTVGFSQDGGPRIFPTAFARVDEYIVIHGSSGSPWLKNISQGCPVALAITRLDAISVARSAFESSFQYRSAVIFGFFTLITDIPEKIKSLDTITNKFIPGRVDEIRSSNKKELAATQVLKLKIEPGNWSLKLSESIPEDTPEDCETEVWAGLVPVNMSYGDPIPVPGLSPHIEVPPSVFKLIATNSPI